MSGGILARRVPVGEIHGQAEFAVDASAEELALLATEYDLLDVRSVRATAVLSATADGVNVEGRVTADIVQTCVVTLVPVEQHIDEPFSVRFVRPGSPELDELMKPHAEIVVDPTAEDPPEVLDGPTLDLGAVVEEAFVLAIDPYPRAPGAALPAEASDTEDAPASPFAVLASLKGGKG
jgi:uncharacterized metal-binding protein YceD (DUF177 family)